MGSGGHALSQERLAAIWIIKIYAQGLLCISPVPTRVPYFSAGDGHAKQGHGEVCDYRVGDGIDRASFV